MVLECLVAQPGPANIEMRTAVIFYFFRALGVRLVKLCVLFHHFERSEALGHDKQEIYRTHENAMPQGL